MKKRLLYALSICILLVSATLNAGASASQTKETPNEEGAVFTEQIVSSFINELKGSDGETYGLSNYFTRRYVAKIREGLEKIVNGFVIKHISDNISIQDFYDEKAQWTGSIKRYTEKQLPDEIRNLVKRKFCDYRITSVDEVETIQSNEVPTYIIHLENDKNIKFLKVHNGELQVWKDISKS